MMCWGVFVASAAPPSPESVDDLTVDDDSLKREGTMGIPHQHKKVTYLVAPAARHAMFGVWFGC